MTLDETTQPHSVIPPTPPAMDHQPHAPKRPKPALVIGIVFFFIALFMVSDAVQSAIMLARNVPEKYHYYLVMQIVVSTITVGALLVIGIALIRMIPWARHVAILLLLSIIALKFVSSFVTLEFTLASPEKAAEDFVHAFWFFAFYGFLINRLRVPAMKAAFARLF